MTAVVLAVVALCVKTAENRRHQDSQRKAAERRTVALLENASDAILAIAHGQILFASGSTRRVLGYEPGWLTAERLADITHPDKLAAVREWTAHLAQSPPGRRPLWSPGAAARTAAGSTSRSPVPTCWPTRTCTR